MNKIDVIRTDDEVDIVANEQLGDRPADDANRGPFGFPVHGERAAALGEVHARPAPQFSSPRTLLKLCFMTDGGKSVDHAVLAQLSRQNGLAPPSADARHHKVIAGSGSVWWERHTEASTYMWEGHAPAEIADTAKGHPFGDAFPAPGLLLAAVRIDVINWLDDLSKLHVIFDPKTMCCSLTESGNAMAITDFRQDKNGLTRIVLMEKGVSQQRLGVLSQRLFDVEIYRTMAMLGLPLAQSLSPRMKRAEDRLAELTHEMRSIGADDAEDLLKEFTSLAAELEADAASSLYRFGASRAYDEIVNDRLNALEESAVPGYATWKNFLGRRLAPAMRTCRAIEERQANLSRKLSRAANLLRTRVDVEVEKQNRDLLNSMNRRAKMQLRLQQTVEGLSVAAVSYYVVGLFAYLASGVISETSPVSKTLVVALFVPVAIGGIWWTVRRIRRRHMEQQ
ncbi:MAG: DUF3422 family protein [Pseudomonadota bacterium]